MIMNKVIAMTTSSSPRPASSLLVRTPDVFWPKKGPPPRLVRRNPGPTWRQLGFLIPDGDDGAATRCSSGTKTTESLLVDEHKRVIIRDLDRCFHLCRDLTRSWEYQFVLAFSNRGQPLRSHFLPAGPR
jgi:hypothetical protein